MIKRVLWLWLLIMLCGSCEKDDGGDASLRLVRMFVGDVQIDLSSLLTEGVPVDRNITLVFSDRLNSESIAEGVQLVADQQPVDANINILSDDRTVSIYPVGVLMYNTVYTVVLTDRLRSQDGARVEPLMISFRTTMAAVTVMEARIGERVVTAVNTISEVPLNLSLDITFSSAIDHDAIRDAIELAGPVSPALVFAYSEDDRRVLITTATPLKHLSAYAFRISDATIGALGEPFNGFEKTLYTETDQTPKFPLISDEELLTLVQQQTFKYFWDFVHPSSGMARERNTSGDVVTSGGSGFGIMALIVGMERGFISRDDGLQRMDQMLTFLENADRFHGAWPHWLNGNTGDVVPFSANDNGGDLVETSFLVQGLLTFRQYLDENVAAEEALIDRINILWQGVEWGWYTRAGEDVLYWHWSPDKQWTMNHPIRGYNEALITYFLAAASPTHTVEAAAYHEGWARSGAIVNNKEFYGIKLPVGFDYGGPLFFSHYSFLGLDPRGLQDTYANYWTQNVNHSRINHAYCVDNPKSYVGYSDECWGLTASDSHGGYSAHSPTNDLGVITPTAALSSLPYTPDESMKALRFFYYTLGDRLWGPYGFYDAFNVTQSWTADSYLAIDQGPIIVMIENHRSGLLWDLFMSSPEVQIAMDKLGFTR